MLGSNHVGALVRYGVACELGLGEACSDLGFLTEHGQGVEANRERAAELYAQACSANHALGCFNRGTLAARRDGDAVTWFRASCQRGYLPAAVRCRQVLGAVCLARLP
jgi:hypothetical protein